MDKLKEILKSALTSHVFWAVISFILVLIFNYYHENNLYSTGATAGLVISAISFVLFGLGAVGLSIFNLFIYLFKKIFKNGK
ncbi:MAG: hypothetical protein AABY15_05555 [Nanoarchaeota archaeon]